MRKVLRGIGIVAAIGVVLMVVVLAVSYVLSETRINRSYDIAADQLAITVPTDAESIKAGERIANTRGCTDCHTPKMSGSVFVDIGPFGRVSAANLTHGQGSGVVDFTDADYVRAIRHGVGKGGKPLWIMPSAEINGIGDADLGKLIAFIKSRPPVDNRLQPNELRPLGRVLFIAGLVPLLSAEQIDHNAKAWANAPAPGVTVEYGKYLAAACTGCHGVSFTGNPGTAPGRNKTPNLTPTGNLKNWSEADFIQVLRGNARPNNGPVIDPAMMPLEGFGSFSDDELKAMYMYLKTLPAKPDYSD